MKSWRCIEVHWYWPLLTLYLKLDIQCAFVGKTTTPDTRSIVKLVSRPDRKLCHSEKPSIYDV